MKSVEKVLDLGAEGAERLGEDDDVIALDGIFCHLRRGWYVTVGGSVAFDQTQQSAFRMRRHGVVTSAQALTCGP